MPSRVVIEETNRFNLWRSYKLRGRSLARIAQNATNAMCWSPSRGSRGERHPQACRMFAANSRYESAANGCWMARNLQLLPLVIERAPRDPIDPITERGVPFRPLEKGPHPAFASRHVLPPDADRIPASCRRSFFWRTSLSARQEPRTQSAIISPATRAALVKSQPSNDPCTAPSSAVSSRPLMWTTL